MVTRFIKLKSVSSVKEFSTTAGSCDFNINLTLGRYMVDAKSIMGILSLDLSKPLIFSAECGEDEPNLRQFEKFFVASQN